jgi:hypothetical protein
VGGHVLEDGPLAEIELDHARHVGVDRLVVAKPVPIALAMVTLPPVRAQQAAQPSVESAGTPWVEEVVVEPAVDHVDASGPGWCA